MNNNKIHFWVTSLYSEDKKNPRYKLFEENLKRVPSLELKPSIDGRNPLRVIEKWIDLNEGNPIVFSNEEGSNMKNKWGALACYLTKLIYFMEFERISNNSKALCLIEDDIVLPEGFEDYVSQALEFSKNNQNEKIITLGPFGEIYILPHSMTGKLIKHLFLINQAVDHKINGSDLCFHYHNWADEIDGYKKLVNKYKPTSEANLEKGRPFIAGRLKNCLQISKGDHGDICSSKTLFIFEKVFELWDNPQFEYKKIVKEFVKFNETQ